MSQNGKGSKPRPFSVPRKVYENNWSNIFNKKEDTKKESSDNGNSAR